MKLAFFDTHSYERQAFLEAPSFARHEITFLEPRLTEATAVLARGADAVCSFVNDRLSRETLSLLKSQGVRLIALRSAGYNHVDLAAAAEMGLPVVRVPAYSPYAVAEHAMALILTLNRKIHRASSRVRELNFALDGLIGFDLHGKTAGVIGTGNIGRVMIRILRGFGCRVLAADTAPDKDLAAELSIEYTELDRLYAEADVITLHVPLTPETRHMINAQSFARMKPSVLLINTSRGALVDTLALIEVLKQHRIGGAGLDVYEEEEGVFFRDLSTEGISDDHLARLLTFPNVVITSHQAFLTREALAEIAETTLSSLNDYAEGRPLRHQIVTASSAKIRPSN